MDPMRKSALVAGVLYLITFVSIPTLWLYGAVHEPGYIAGTGSNSGVIIGVVLELIVALACVGTAVALFPVVRRQNEVMAMGFVGARLLEAATIMLGIVSLATIVTLRRNGAGTDATVTGDALVAIYDRTFLFGQSFMPAVNGMLLGTLMYRSRLVPRLLPLLGLIGAPLLIAAQAGVLFDLWDRSSAATGLGALPIAVWELSLGLYLVIKGFRPSAIDTLANRPDPLWTAHQPISSTGAAVTL
ncbi:MAG: DUF4386 domain-containing protein [Acidimicrobiia bacterium]|nr:DUF4386 domain-containing protein [Acidimicrobiia bacterium]